MKPVALIAEFMARELITLSPDMEINAAMALLLEHRISGAPVLDASGNLVGILTKKDCLKAAIDASYYRDWGATVDAHMSKEVETLDSDTDVLTAAEKFLTSPYRRFPVIQNGNLVGQISRSDALRAMKDNWQ